MQRIITLKLKAGVNPYDPKLGVPMRVLSFAALPSGGWTARVLVNTDSQPAPCSFTVAQDGTGVATTMPFALQAVTANAGLWSDCMAGNV